jgi:hypothetical protein
VTDALAVGANERGHALGADALHALLRGVHCRSGRVELAVEYAPRPQYGLVRPPLVPVAGGVVSDASRHGFVLSSPVASRLPMASPRPGWGCGPGSGWGSRCSTSRPGSRPECGASGGSGFTPAGSPRMHATIRAVAGRLTDPRGLVHRYQADTDDGLPGADGAFLPCTFWLAHVLALAADPEGGREVFERAIRHANDVALLARRSTPPATSCSATSPRRSATSGSSTRPGPSRKPRPKTPRGALVWESRTRKAGQRKPVGDGGRGACRRT